MHSKVIATTSKSVQSPIFFLLLNRGHVFPVWDVATAPLGHYFASASADHSARVWVTERAQSLRLLAGEHLGMAFVYMPSLQHERSILQPLQRCACAMADAQGLRRACRAPLGCRRRAVAPQRGPAGERL